MLLLEVSQESVLGKMPLNVSVNDNGSKYKIAAIENNTYFNSADEIVLNKETNSDESMWSY